MGHPVYFTNPYFFTQSSPRGRSKSLAAETLANGEFEADKCDECDYGFAGQESGQSQPKRRKSILGFLNGK